jgi:hypothetical protein
LGIDAVRIGNAKDAGGEECSDGAGHPRKAGEEKVDGCDAEGGKRRAGRLEGIGPRVDVVEPGCGGLVGSGETKARRTC